ncbi:MAG: hypothetical protein KAV00_16015, partial [Phycisphaerae bacterium]|nr:hypothetical protein [Phycisphaerae bacterium]
GGTADAGGFWVDFYASTNNLISTGDYFIDDVWVSGVTAGSYESVNLSNIPFPSSIPLGDYYVGAIIDATDSVSESNEGNNIVEFDPAATTPTLTVTGQPDLYDDGDSWSWFYPTTVTSPGTPGYGAPWEVHFDIRNGGTADAGGFWVDVYLSDNDIISTSDRFLGDVWVSGVTAGSYAGADLYWATFPGGVPLGVYYVGIIIDSTNNVAESNEGNNTGVDLDDYLTVIGQPDLYDDGDWYNGFSPITIEHGQTWSAWLDVRNGGTADAGGFYVDFYASTNNIISTGDYFIDDVWVSGVTAGSYVDVDLSTNFPTSIPLGDYYVGAIIDSTNSVSESDEGNNTVEFDPAATTPTLTVTGQPDLYDDGDTWSDFSPTTVEAGDTWSAWMDVGNGGTVAAGGFYIDYYASTNTIISVSDYYLGRDYIPGVSAGSYENSQLDLSSFPSTVPAGDYWVGWIIDADDDVTESNESNNKGYNGEYQLTVTGQPDLYDDGDSWNGFSPMTIISGDPWLAWMDVANGGTADAGGFWVDFYASTNNIISTGDYFLGDVWVSGVTAGSYKSVDLSINFPTGIPDGDYYVGTIIDPTDSVSESDEGNNIHTFDDYPLTVTSPVDLSGDYFNVVLEPLSAGESFDVNFEVQNTESGSAGAFYVSFYVSTNNIISTSDYYLGYYWISSLAGNSTTGTLTDNLTLPTEAEWGYSNGLPALYYIGMIVDSTGSVTETDETNNDSTGEFLDYDSL